MAAAAAVLAVMLLRSAAVRCVECGISGSRSCSDNAAGAREHGSAIKPYRTMTSSTSVSESPTVRGRKAHQVRAGSQETTCGVSTLV